MPRGSNAFRAEADRFSVAVVPVVTAGLAVLAFAYGIIDLAIHPWALGAVLAPVAFVAGIVATVAALWAMRAPPRRLGEVAVTVIALLGILHGLLSAGLSETPRGSEDVMLVLVGAGAFLISRRWLMTIIGSASIGWVLTAAMVGWSRAWVQAGISLAFFAGLAILIQRVHRAALAQVAASRAEQERVAGVLEDSLADHRKIAENASDLVGVYDLTGRCTYVSDSVEGLLGYTPEEFAGKSAYDYIHPDDLSVVRSAHERFLAAGAPIPTECRLRRKDGSYVWVDTRGGAFTDAQGRPLVVVGFQEITERKRVAAEREDLVGRLRDQNRDLEAFNYMVSHDLKAPLRTIDILTAAVLEDHAVGLDEQARRDLERVRDASRRMGDLITGLMELARVNREPLRTVDVDVSALAEEIMEDIHVRDRTRVIVTYVEPGIRASADERLLRSVLENLIGNAWKYTRSSAAPRIDVGQREDGAYFVRDNGVGFPQEQADRLFQPFSRLESAKGVGGAGIGLASVARIVERHGGRVWAESAPGEGATFFFTLGTVLEPAAGGRFSMPGQKLTRAPPG